MNKVENQKVDDSAHLAHASSTLDKSRTIPVDGKWHCVKSESKNITNAEIQRYIREDKGLGDFRIDKVYSARSGIHTTYFKCAFSSKCNCSFKIGRSEDTRIWVSWRKRLGKYLKPRRRRRRWRLSTQSIHQRKSSSNDGSSTTSMNRTSTNSSPKTIVAMINTYLDAPIDMNTKPVTSTHLERSSPACKMKQQASSDEVVLFVLKEWNYENY